MKRLILIIGGVCLLVATTAWAQLDTAWVRHFDGGVSSDEVTALKVDGAGNAYVTGRSTNGDGNYDYITIKYNPDGDSLWMSRYSGLTAGNDEPQDIWVDDAGNVYVTGYSGTNGVGTGQDYATIKYNADGDTVWVRRYYHIAGATNEDLANAVQVDGDGNVYVTGASRGTISSPDFATIKYNADGDTLWVRRYNGPANHIDGAYALGLDGLGNVCVTGFSRNSSGTADFFTIKYNSSGTTLWTDRYNGPADDEDVASDIHVDASGNVYVTGYSTGSSSSYDYTTIKYNTDGDTLWLRRYNGAGNSADYPRDLWVDADGNVYVTGTSQGGGTADDYLTIKYDADGNTLWVRNYQPINPRNDDGYAIAVSSTGKVYVTGQEDRLYPRDCVTLKYDSDGNLLRTWAYNGPGDSHDVGTCIGLDGDGNVIVAGTCTGEQSGTDYLVMKIRACECPNQGDVNANGVFNGQDIVALLDVLFSGSAGPQDAQCPAARGDYNGNGVTDAVDLAMMVDYFLGGVPPIDPCACPGGFPCAHSYFYLPTNSVTVTSKTAGIGETGVSIPILISNDVSLRSIVVPLVVRSVTPGSFITSLKLSWRERLPATLGAALSYSRVTNQYNPEDGACKQGQAGGFGTITYGNDTLSHAVAGSPIGLLFHASKSSGAALLPGDDVTGSLMLTIDVTSVEGTFEVDTTCTDPANHLLFLEDVAAPAGTTPAFTKGVITIQRLQPVVSTLESDGPGSLREAVLLANLQPGADSITFSVAGIIHSTAILYLDDQTGGTVIDGLSAPGATETSPTVILDGSLTAPSGFEILSSGNAIKGLTIRNFAGSGIILTPPVDPAGVHNRFTANRIHSNGGLGIDLGNDGVTVNDDADLDAGPNDLLNYPTLDTVFLVENDSFYVAGNACPNSRVELFLAQRYLGDDTISDPTHHGEAWQYLGAAIAEGDGHFAFPKVGEGYWSYVTATATDPLGNTSEFSLNRQLIPDSLIITVYSPVTIKVVEPDDTDSIGPTFNTIGATASYDASTDYGVGPSGVQGELDDRIVITNVQEGEYRIVVSPDEGSGGSAYFCGIRVDGTEQAYVAATGAMSSVPVSIPVPDEGDVDQFAFGANPVTRGDFDGDGYLTALDLSVMIDILFAGTPLPDPPGLADLNCDGFPDSLDLALIIDHLFAGGDAPCF